MTSVEHSFDPILVKLETSLHLVEEMESVLKQMTTHTDLAPTGELRMTESNDRAQRAR